MAKGGMSKNAFGQRSRLDHIDLMKFTSSTSSPESLLYLSTIQDAIHNYLFFCLGRNGTTADEFAWSCDYLFNIRSWDKPSWEHATVMPGHDKALTDEQIKGMCFDTHYELSGLAKYMDLKVFIEKIAKERRKILVENLYQVQEYLSNLQGKSLGGKVGQQTALSLEIGQVLDILTKPANLVDIAKLVYAPSSYTGLSEKNSSSNDSSSSSGSNRHRVVTLSSNKGKAAI